MLKVQGQLAFLKDYSNGLIATVGRNSIAPT
jgi:hypothetical protein